MRDRTFNHVMDAVGLIVTTSMLYYGCRWLASIEPPPLAAIACFGVVTWLAFGEIVRQHFARHVAAYRCLEHIAFEQPAMAIPMSAGWPIIVLLHSCCRAKAPAHNGG